MCPQTFSRPLFMTSFSCTLSEWGTTRPPRQATAMWAAAQAAHTASQVRGGLGSPSGPSYRLPASALPQIRLWADLLFHQKLVDPRKQPTAETLPLLRALTGACHLTNLRSGRPLLICRFRLLEVPLNSNWRNHGSVRKPHCCFQSRCFQDTI